MPDVDTDTSGWHESADIITDGGDKPCAERMFVHECGAMLSLYSGWWPWPGAMCWWWRIQWGGYIANGLSAQADRGAWPSEVQNDDVPISWATECLRLWRIIE